MKVRVVLESMVLNLNVNVPSTWGEAASALEVNDPKLGRVKVSLWKNLHFRKAAYWSMSLLRVERRASMET